MPYWVARWSCRKDVLHLRDMMNDIYIDRVVSISIRPLDQKLMTCM